MGNNPDKEELAKAEAELRQKFGPGVSIRYDLPSRQELQQSNSFLSMVGQSVGVQKWMWASFSGLLLGVIVVPPTINSIVDYWKPKAIVGYEIAAPYLSTIGNFAEDLGEDVIAFLPKPDSPFDPANIDRIAIAPLDRIRGGQPSSEQTGRLYLDVFPVFSTSSVFFRTIPAPYAGLANISDQLLDSEDDKKVLESLMGPKINATNRLLDVVRRYGASVGGRFNPAGLPALYAANSVLGAAAESLAYGRRNLVAQSISLSCTAVELTEASAKSIGLDLNDRQSCSQFGQAWISASPSTALIYPSRVRPGSKNIVVNVSLVKEREIEVLREEGLPPPEMLEKLLA